jgi:hypothetical protein
VDFLERVETSCTVLFVLFVCLFSFPVVAAAFDDEDDYLVLLLVLYEFVSCLKLTA